MLTIDYANCLADRVGSHGLDAAMFDPAGQPAMTCRALTASLDKTRGTGWERWRALPHDPVRSDHLRQVRSAVSACADRFENMVVLGIGGSALGNIALQSALNPPTHNLLSGAPGGPRRGPRMFVIDNVDPEYFAQTLSFCESAPGGLEKTLFNVISKSGETAETAAQFMIVREALRKRLGDRYAGNIVAATDPAQGTMRRICDQEGIATLPVPDGVGGRFSVLSPVGLFSAAMTGIDVEAMLQGAAEMDAACRREELTANPAAMLAFLLVELGTTKGKTNHVLMPYANSLYLLADWYRQLWAESLGKRVDRAGETVFAGFTPIKALGTTDQHSQVQLYREGPNDKVIGFLEVNSFRREVQIPTGLGVEALMYLEGRRMSELLSAEKRATEYALLESQRPNYTIRFPEIDARHVGQFLWLWQVATSYAGLMLDIDAYDQPAVELGKQATFGLMGRKGYETHKRSVDGALTPTRWVI
ncbi:MAG: glucose-6-phosphate isomerase [Phycisphaeraceae bacterium]|nr:glucose-6-phosphate isomerase [Phycisphaerae bacterium]MBX3393453.1 glucose-6-phosphate isomerase [Phycisphaeraceae bacterium]HRJ49069.1 glucose-6-phosphate isomerase [Phycisphaerales bacterium]